MIACRQALVLAVAVVATSACGARTAPVFEHDRSARVSVALYHADARSIALVEDQRWVTIDGPAIVLDHLDPKLSLSSLTITPVAGGDLSVGSCHRDRIDDARATRAFDETGRREEPPPLASSAIQCAVTGPRGRRLIRITYTSAALSLDVSHHLKVVEPGRAEVVTKLAVPTLALARTGQLVVFRGVPGGERSPVEVVRGAIVFDGSTAILTSSPHAISAVEKWIVDPELRPRSGIRPGVPDLPVKVWLELEAEVIPGPMTMVMGAAGERTIGVDAMTTSSGRIRIPLRVDATLQAQRRVAPSFAKSGPELVYTFAITNKGDRPREVWVEESLPASEARRLAGGWPTKPRVEGDKVMVKVVVPASGVERAGFRLRMTE
ncbi:MAG: hypothetical protein AB7P03_21720 [Kofleriaceae bacterium]